MSELDHIAAIAVAELLSEVSEAEIDRVLATVTGSSPELTTERDRRSRRRNWLLPGIAAAVAAVVVATGMWFDRGDGRIVTTSTPSTPTSSEVAHPRPAASTSLPRTPRSAPSEVTPDDVATTPAVTATVETAPAPTDPASVPASAPVSAPPTSAPTVVGPLLTISVEMMDLTSSGARWAIGRSDDGVRRLARSDDSGATWVEIPGPVAATTSSAFADSTNGWLVDDAGLSSTHDGGATWRRVALDSAGCDGDVVAVAASGGFVHVATAGGGPIGLGVMLCTSDAGLDAFQPFDVDVPVGAGPVPSGSFAFAGEAGWFIAHNRTTTGAARFANGVWSHWEVTCELGPARPVSSGQTGDVVVACDGGMWGDGTVTEIRRSSDGGRTFVSVPVPEGPVRAWHVAGVTSNGTIVVTDATGGGAAPDGGPALATDDDGVTWHELGWPFVPASFEGDGDLIVSLALGGDGSATSWTSTDSGGSWRSVTVAVPMPV